VPQLTAEHLALWLTSYVVLLFSLSVHESAHGWMAHRMGDDTALSQGRVTLNPLAHIDLIGTIVMPLAQLMFASFPFLAWAKPTPVGAHNFRNLARGHILVAGAGPASNLLLSVVFLGALFVGRQFGLQPSASDPVFSLLSAGVILNAVLAVFNLLPLPPLDGSWIASWGLPRSIAQHYDRLMEPYGNLILLVLFVSGALGHVIQPVIEQARALVGRLVA
jgi:Zn-dependent protease